MDLNTFQFIAPPITFVLLHVILHVNSRSGHDERVWPLLNVGIHFCVLATSLQFGYVTFLAARSTTGATPFQAVFLLVVCLMFSFVVSMLDRWVYGRHRAAAATKQSRKADVWEAMHVLLPSSFGFLLFVLVLRQVVIASTPVNGF